MLAGAVLSYLVIGPLIATFGEKVSVPVSPAVSAINSETGKDAGLIAQHGGRTDLKANSSATSAPGPSRPAASSACCGRCP